MPKSTLSFTFGSWYFKPRITLSILALILFTILVNLGFWQLRRATEKEELLARLEHRITLPPVNIKNIDSPSLHDHRFLPVLIDGLYMNQHTFLLDNQMYKHKPGYRVLTPLQSPNLSQWVIVDRGWVAAGNDRSKLPEIQPIYGLQKVLGHINTISSGVVWKKDEVQNSPSWPILIQEIDYHFISEQMHHQTHKFVIQLDPKNKHAFNFPDTTINLNSDKNIGYAMQWFTFSSFVLIYYIIVSTKRKKK